MILTKKRTSTKTPSAMGYDKIKESAGPIPGMDKQSDQIIIGQFLLLLVPILLKSTAHLYNNPFIHGGYVICVKCLQCHAVKPPWSEEPGTPECLMRIR
ncbi:MAG: hypothetical protein WAM14_04090 [Candidatus Nitrosopolaris sp.]